MREPGERVLRGWTAVAVLLLLMGMMGCKSCRKDAFPKVTCKLPAAMLTELSATQSVFDLDPEKKVRWMKAIRSGCKPWPRYAQKAMDVTIPSDPGQPILLSAPPLWALAEYKRAEKQLCPGFEKVRGPPPLGRKRRSQMIRQYWARCGLAKLGLMNRDEFENNGALAFSAMAMHRMLVKGGLGSGVARKMVRLFLLDEPHLRRVKAARVQLPKSRSTAIMADAVEIVINEKGVRCRGNTMASVKGWKVDPNSKRDGPDGFFIDPLFKKLKEEARKLKAANKKSGWPFWGHILLTVDGRARYRLLAEVLYTASQAEFKRVQLLVQGADGKPSVVVIHETRLSRIRATDEQKPRFEPPELWVSDTEYVVQFGAGGAVTRFSKANGKTTALHKLATFLRARLAKRKSVKLPDQVWGQILLNTHPQTPFAELVGVLDAIRERKDGPPGCHLRHDKKQGRWLVPSRARKACLYPKPILKLGYSDPPPGLR